MQCLVWIFLYEHFDNKYQVIKRIKLQKNIGWIEELPIVQKIGKGLAIAGRLLKFDAPLE